jgi:hypothetical protein
MTAIIEYLDQPPPGWFVLDVMPAKEGRTRDWVALMVDVHPDEYAAAVRSAFRRWDGVDKLEVAVRECWLRVPGKYKDRDAAWDAALDLMATRH